MLESYGRHCVNYATESCEQKHFSDWPHEICISMSFPFRRGIFKKSLAHNLPQISSKKILSCVCCGCNSCYMEWICFFFIMLIVFINGQMVHCNELWDGVLFFPFIKDGPSVSYARVGWSLLLPAEFKSNSSHHSLSDCCTTLMVASFGCTLFIFGFEITASLTLPFAPCPDSCLAEQTCFMPISITYLCSELLAGEQYGDHSGISPVSHVDCRGWIWILFEKEPIT